MTEEILAHVASLQWIASLDDLTDETMHSARATAVQRSAPLGEAQAFRDSLWNRSPPPDGPTRNVMHTRGHSGRVLRFNHFD